MDTKRRNRQVRRSESKRQKEKGKGFDDSVLEAWTANRKSRSERLDIWAFVYSDSEMEFVEDGSGYKYIEFNSSGTKESRRPVSTTLRVRKRKLTSKDVLPYKLRPLNSSDGIASDQSIHCQNQKESRDLLSNSGGEDVDVGSEASLERYINIVLKGSDGRFSNCDLVEAAPLQVAKISTGSLMHFNFKVKKKDEPDAVVQTYFAELSKTLRNCVRVNCVRLLGPSSSLPDKAKTFGCSYCRSQSIHHHITGGFQTGREEHWTILCSSINKIRKFIDLSEERGFSPKFMDPGLMYFTETFDTTKALLATAALSLFNAEKGTNFEPVNVEYVDLSMGRFGIGLTKLGFVIHLNFEAKNKNDPDASVQTFFAEVVKDINFLFAACCECLGPSDSLPEEDDSYCRYCSPKIHHPCGPGYLTG